METRKINIPKSVETFTTFIGETKFLIIKNEKNSKYVLLPKFVEVCKDKEFLTLKVNSEDKVLLSKFKLFNNWLNFYLKNSETVYKKRLTLKGLGYRITVIENRTKIEFKLGFSHLIRIPIPENIRVKTKKTLLKLESTNKILLGNYADKIVSLKLPDSYKGKGFWFKYQTKTLKIIKKK